MPTWGELIPELRDAGTQHGASAFDVVRRKYLSALVAHTGRNAILYATKWTGPSLLVQCINALNLAEDLVAEWLRSWMFAPFGRKQAARKARTIARKLADHSKFKSHGRPIHRDAAQGMGLVVDNLETDQTFQDLVLTVYHATMHTFGATAAAKIIENHLGSAFVKSQIVQNVQLQLAPAPSQQPLSQ